ncbi:MAG: archaeosortase H [Promethearchaeota archaeon]
MIINKLKITANILSLTFLIVAFLFGLNASPGTNDNNPFIWLIYVFLLIALEFLVIKVLNLGKKPLEIRYIFLIWLYLILNLIFVFVIGYTIPMMETTNKYNFAIVMIPLLCILNIIIVERYDFLLKGKEREINTEEIEKEVPLEPQKINKPIIEFEGRRYYFSLNSLIILTIGTPILSYLIYIFFDIEFNHWLHEIVVKQTVFFLNLIFNMGAKAVYIGGGTYPWMFQIPGRGGIYFETFCTGVQAIAVFCGIIICTPHSQDPIAKSDIIWRKTKSLIVSSVVFYVVNIIRMLIQLELYYIGYEWADIHYSISAASSFIAAIIILLLHKWIPEFIISIIYIGTVITRPIKRKRIEKLKEIIKNTGKIDLNLLRKILRFPLLSMKEFSEDFCKSFGLIQKGEKAIIPEERMQEIIDQLDIKKLFREWSNIFKEKLRNKQK